MFSENFASYWTLQIFKSKLGAVLVQAVLLDLKLEIYRFKLGLCLGPTLKFWSWFDGYLF